MSPMQPQCLCARGALVYAGDYNGTLVAVYDYNRPPCIHLISCPELQTDTPVKEDFVSSKKKTIIGLKNQDIFLFKMPSALLLKR